MIHTRFAYSPRSPDICPYLTMQVHNKVVHSLPSSPPPTTLIQTAKYKSQCCRLHIEGNKRHWFWNMKSTPWSRFKEESNRNDFEEKTTIHHTYHKLTLMRKQHAGLVSKFQPWEDGVLGGEYYVIFFLVVKGLITFAPTLPPTAKLISEASFGPPRERSA